MESFIFFLCVAVAMIFFMLGRRQRNKHGNTDSEAPANINQSELLRYRRLRAIRLNEPLTERIRPKNFSEIIGQREGIEALKAALAAENPQHIIIYGPPGVGKTAAARLALEYAKNQISSPFRPDAPFVEIDGATARFDERGIADPLLGSVHDPIYQGAGTLGNRGIPQPKPGAVNRAHGGVLFIDEIGELHSSQINKLLKVLEERRVMPESAYYDPFDKNIPEYIHDQFKNGLPADFRLIGATTRKAGEIPEALRSRCVEIYFRALQPSEIAEIAVNAARELELGLSEGTLETICEYAASGRDAVNILQLAKGFCDSIVVEPQTIERIAQIAHYARRKLFELPQEAKIGHCTGLCEGEGGCFLPVHIEAEVFRDEHPQLVISASDSSSEHMEILKSVVLKAVTAIKRVTADDFEEYDVHINFQLNGAEPDSSLILPAAVAMFSACSGREVRRELLFCGELHINGELQVLEKQYGINEFMRNYPQAKMLCHCCGAKAAQEPFLHAESLAEVFAQAFCQSGTGKLVFLHHTRAREQIIPAER